MTRQLRGTRPQEPQGRGTRLQPSQELARPRVPLRQARPGLSRRWRPISDRAPAHLRLRTGGL